MTKLIMAQCNVLLHQKGFRICFSLFMCFISVNFLHNVVQFWNVEQADMYSFLEISCLSSNNPIGWYIIEFFSFLVVLPGALSFMYERKAKVDILWIAKCGEKRYIISKMIAVGLVTFLCFFVPLIIELLLNLIAFPYHAHGNFMEYALYENEYKVIQQYFLFSLYYNHPALYAIVMSAGISFIAALLSMIPLAASFYITEFYANLMIPVYLILNIINNTEFTILGIAFHHDYAAYIQWCGSGIDKKSIIAFGGIIIMLSIVSGLVMLFQAGKDTL